MSNNDELLPEQTDGFKVGEKKTIDEYHQMGAFKLHKKYVFIPCLSTVLLATKEFLLGFPFFMAFSMSRGRAARETHFARFRSANSEPWTFVALLSESSFQHVNIARQQL